MARAPLVLSILDLTKNRKHVWLILAHRIHKLLPKMEDAKIAKTLHTLTKMERPVFQTNAPTLKYCCLMELAKLVKHIHALIRKAKNVSKTHVDKRHKSQRLMVNARLANHISGLIKLGWSVFKISVIHLLTRSNH